MFQKRSAAKFRMPETSSARDVQQIRITSILLIEHRVLRDLMQAMELALLAKTSAAALRERALMLQVAIETHAAREEEQLFTPVKARSETARHLIDMMELVHAEVSDLFRQVQGETDPARTLWTILEMTAAHFDREEQQVFPLAETLLSEDVLLQSVVQYSSRLV